LAELSNVAADSLAKWAGDTRATLAIVFTDIVGSTALGNRLGDVRMSIVRVAHFARSAMLLGQYAGREIKTIGDSVMAVFHSVGAAFDYAYALYLDPGHDELRVAGVRAGIHIGTVEVEQNDVFGSEVAFAARVAHEIQGAEIWLSSQAFADLETVRATHHENLRWCEHPAIVLKGFKDTHTLWSLARPRKGRSLAEVAAGKSPSTARVPPPQPATSTDNTLSRSKATKVTLRRYILIMTSIVLVIGALVAAESTFGNWESVKRIFTSAKPASDPTPRTTTHVCDGLSTEACIILQKRYQENPK
jgi:class 3 adenylate cyclase